MPPWVVSLSRSATGFFQKRKVRLVICGATVLASVTVYLLKFDQEPSYKGIKASEWLYSLNGANGLAETYHYFETTNAFHAMGVKGARYLGKELLKEPSPIQQWAIAHQHSIPPKLMKLVYDPAKTSKPEAIFKLLGDLGTNGAPAIHALIEWYHGKGTYQQSQQNKMSSFLNTGFSLIIFERKARLISSPGGNSAAFVSYGKTNSAMVISGTNRVSSVFNGGSMILTNQPAYIVYGKTNINLKVQGNVVYAPISWVIRNLILVCGTDDPRAVELLIEMSKQGNWQPAIPQHISPLLEPAIRKSEAKLLRMSESPNPISRELAIRLLALEEPGSK